MKKIAPVLFNLFLAGFFFSIFNSSVHANPVFTNEGGIRLSSAVPLAVDITTSPIRMYFLRDYKVYSATSTDQLNWGEETGVRLSSTTAINVNISSITGFALVRRSDNAGYHAVYSGIGVLGDYGIIIATSTDGLGWANQAGAFIPTSTNTFVGSPQLYRTSASNLIMYFTQNTDGTTNPTNRIIYGAMSTDEGLTWVSPGVALSEQVGEICVSTLTSGRVRLIYTAPLTGETTYSTLLSARSPDSLGTTFSLESNTMLSTGSSTGEMSYPTVIRSTENFRWRLYYAFRNASTTTAHVFSAITYTPDPQSITPSVMNRTDPAATVTIAGEIFGPTISSVELTATGLADIVGTSINLTNDNSITAIIDPLNQALGPRTLRVTNADGNEGSKAGAFEISFAGGTVRMLDNLMRPLSGAQTRIDIEVFDVGHLVLKLYDLSGRLIKTLFDGDSVVGTQTTYWDGRNDDGSLVASGVYVLQIEGPKLESEQKIVVIK